MKDRGNELEDLVASYFQSMGYDVQTRVRIPDRRDVLHEIDVIASKRTDVGVTNQYPVECKHVSSPIDIKELRNFNDKLFALGLTNGIFVSTGGFTADAEAFADSVNIEMWDEKELEQRLARRDLPDENVIHDALPLNSALITSLAPRHLKGSNVLSESINLDYLPYYFADYHCFSEHSVRGDSVYIESGGSVVIDGYDGRIVDSKQTVGNVEPELPRIGVYVGCIGLQPQTITTEIFEDLPDNVQPRGCAFAVELRRAKELAKIELVKSLSYRYSYTTSRGSGVQVVIPRKKDIEILRIQPVKIPHLIGTYRFRNYAYERTCLASTGVFVLDQTSKCLSCPNQASAVCGNCGVIVCNSHLRTCSACSMSLCTNCVVSKGIISRTNYCPNHQPRK
jgi:hypothetical protein